MACIWVLFNLLSASESEKGLGPSGLPLLAAPSLVIIQTILTKIEGSELGMPYQGCLCQQGSSTPLLHLPKCEQDAQLCSALHLYSLRAAQHAPALPTK